VIEALSLNSQKDFYTCLSWFSLVRTLNRCDISWWCFISCWSLFHSNIQSLSSHLYFIVLYSIQFQSRFTVINRKLMIQLFKSSSIWL